MSTLHIISTSPTAGTALADCLRAVSPGDALLFTQDGVYALMTQITAIPRNLHLHALTQDIEARGLTVKIPLRVKTTDDDGFVALTETHARCVSWF